MSDGVENRKNIVKSKATDTIRMSRCKESGSFFGDEGHDINMKNNAHSEKSIKQSRRAKKKSTKDVLTKEISKWPSFGLMEETHDHLFKHSMRPEERGEIGEQEASALLQKVLRGHVSRFQGQADKGLDLAFVGRLPCPERPLVHFVAQIKTGQSFVKRFGVGPEMKVKKVAAKKILEWRNLEAPVLFLWLDDNKNEVYWRIVSKGGRAKSLYLAERSTLSPLTRYDLVVRLNRERKVTNNRISIDPLSARPKESLKQVALAYYKRELHRTVSRNPVLGDIRFTWRGWRHIVRRRNTVAKMMRSLQLLPAAKKVLSDPGEICGFRRLANTTRGKWTTESRLIAFKRCEVEIKGGRPADIVVVVRERIVYPINWRECFDFDQRIIRHLRFESIYEQLDEDTKKKRRAP